MAAPRVLRLVPAVAVAAAALVGCGGEDEETPARAVTVDAADGLKVAAGEYFFDPGAVVVDAARGPLEITLDNEGSLAHNLRLFLGEEEVGGTETFPGGESRSAEVELAPGSYRMVCTVGNHAELGMTGELELR